MQPEVLQPVTMTVSPRALLKYSATPVLKEIDGTFLPPVRADDGRDIALASPCVSVGHGALGVARGGERGPDGAKRNAGNILFVMPALVAGIPLRNAKMCPLYRDGRDKPRHDGGAAVRPKLS